MTDSGRIKQWLMTGSISFLLGTLFTLVVGNLTTIDYLVELFNVIPLEIVIMVVIAIWVKRFGLAMSIVFAVLGTIVSFGWSYRSLSLVPVVFFKASVAGIILGENKWLSGSFFRRSLLVSLPGIIFSCIIGVPLIVNNVPEEVLSKIQQSLLDGYRLFLPQDEALNAVGNALSIVKGMISAGLAVFFIGSFIAVWLSFFVARWAMKKVKMEPESIPSFNTFKVPFHAVWIFIVGFGFFLSGYESVFPWALNMVVFMAFLYFVQGFAIVISYINTLSVGFIGRVIFWLIFFITIAFSGLFLIIIGIADNWFRLRVTPKLDEKE